jgi:hypothetical protein
LNLVGGILQGAEELATEAYLDNSEYEEAELILNATKGSTK